MDLGASWLNGATANPLLALARDLRVRTSESAYDELPLVYDANGALIPRHSWVKVKQQAEEILDRAAAMRGARLSLGEALNVLFESTTSGRTACCTA